MQCKEKRRCLIEDVKQRLLALHRPATFEPPSYLRKWFTPETSSMFLHQAVAIWPTRITYQVGIPFMCHEKNATCYAIEQMKRNPRYTGFPYFGFRLFDEGDRSGQGDGALRWCVHSFVLEDDGTAVVDSVGLLPPS